MRISVFSFLFVVGLFNATAQAEFVCNGAGAPNKKAVLKTFRYNYQGLDPVTGQKVGPGVREYLAGVAQYAVLANDQNLALRVMTIRARIDLFNLIHDLPGAPQTCKEGIAMVNGITSSVSNIFN